MHLRVAATLATVMLRATVLGAQTPSPDVAAWRADLHLLATELPARHPAPFLKITRAEWDSAVARLDRRLPDLNRDQILVELFRLVAALGDAHTGIEPTPSLGLRYYPVELYSFEDGLFVRRAPVRAGARPPPRPAPPPGPPGPSPARGGRGGGGGAFGLSGCCASLLS